MVFTLCVVLGRCHSGSADEPNHLSTHRKAALLCSAHPSPWVQMHSILPTPRAMAFKGEKDILSQQPPRCSKSSVRGKQKPGLDHQPLTAWLIAARSHSLKSISFPLHPVHTGEILPTPSHSADASLSLCRLILTLIHTSRVLSGAALHPFPPL